MAASIGFLETVNRNFDAAASYLDYPPGLLDQIKICNSIYKFSFPVRKRRHPRSDLRTAAFITAIDKIAVSYMELGIFP